jgi:osmoprotectant transport system permease protein
VIFLQAFAWIFDGSNWVTGPVALQRLVETLVLGGWSLLFIVIIAFPLGVFIGHTGRGRSAAILVSNVARALPTLGLLSILVLFLGIGLLPAVIVLVILGIPPLLAGVYAGLEAVDRQTIDAARAMGMTEMQIVTRVELPLALPLILGGFRATVLQVVATAVVASFFQSSGLGYLVTQGLASTDYVKVLAGAILIVVLVLILDAILAIVQKLVVPRGVSRGGTDPDVGSPTRGRSRNSASPRPRTPTLQEGMQS